MTAGNGAIAVRTAETEEPVEGGRPRELTPAELDAWRGFLNTHATLVRQLDAAMQAEHRVPLSAYEVLKALNDAPDGRLRMTDLARAAGLSLSGLSRMVGRLEREELAQREPCPSDHRGSYAVLTAAGATLVREAGATHLSGVRALFLDAFTAEEAALLGRLWGKVEERAREARVKGTRHKGRRAPTGEDGAELTLDAADRQW